MCPSPVPRHLSSCIYPAITWINRSGSSDLEDIESSVVGARAVEYPHLHYAATDREGRHVAARRLAGENVAHILTELEKGIFLTIVRCLEFVDNSNVLPVTDRALRRPSF